MTTLTTLSLDWMASINSWGRVRPRVCFQSIPSEAFDWQYWQQNILPCHTPSGTARGRGWCATHCPHAHVEAGGVGDEDVGGGVGCLCHGPLLLDPGRLPGDDDPIGDATIASLLFFRGDPSKPS